MKNNRQTHEIIREDARFALYVESILENNQAGKLDFFPSESYFCCRRIYNFDSFH